MELVAGVSLEEQARRRQAALEVAEILRIGAQVAAGLAAAHARGLIHRDIKPANILLENGSQRVKITDFGLARAADDVRLTQEGALAGTPQYMAPEQARGETVDHRTDLFSLGSVLYTLCTGRPPFRGETMVAVLMNVCEKTPTPIRDINPDIPEELVLVIDRLMAKNPADRFQHAQEVFDMLTATRPNVQRPRPRPPVPAARRQPKRTTALPWIIAASVLGWLVFCFAVSEAIGLTSISRSALALFFPSSLQPQPTTVLKKFTTTDKMQTQDGVEKHKDHWTITAKEPRTVNLFEVAAPDVEKCVVFYQAKLKTENIQGKAYLQMWFRFPGKGEFFSKGLQSPVSGTTDWTSAQIPFFLKEGERPDLIKLELVIEGTGTVSIKDIQLSKGPLPN
jgi:serine/threonine protein kinase